MSLAAFAPAFVAAPHSLRTAAPWTRAPTLHSFVASALCIACRVPWTPYADALARQAAGHAPGKSRSWRTPGVPGNRERFLERLRPFRFSPRSQGVGSGMARRA